MCTYVRLFFSPFRNTSLFPPVRSSARLGILSAAELLYNIGKPFQTSNPGISRLCVRPNGLDDDKEYEWRDDAVEKSTGFEIYRGSKYIDIVRDCAIKVLRVA